MLSRDWTIDYTEVHPNTLDINFGFILNTTPVTFDNLTFGVIVTNASNIVYYSCYPKPGTTYINTDQEFLEKFRVESLVYNTTYNLKAWVDNYSIKTETNYSFTTPNVPPLPDYEVV